MLLKWVTKAFDFYECLFELIRAHGKDNSDPSVRVRSYKYNWFKITGVHLPGS